MARVYLQMANYEEALKYADMALEQNDNLPAWFQITTWMIMCKNDSY